MDNNVLTINNDVLAKMAGMAALECEGVAALSKFTAPVKNIVTGEFTRSVKVDTENGLVNLEVYIKVKSDCNAREVAANVQNKVKENIQNMTGTAINRVNVVVADIEFCENDA
ncbi:MAG: Asp23/Gls24 family envelope stress response protein [Oscillospiraceae bacterium]|nr:Asp23/Gls24 family envelope stress response protein [Candidatus Equicaccousia limihippi]